MELKNGTKYFGSAHLLTCHVMEQDRHMEGWMETNAYCYHLVDSI